MVEGRAERRPVAAAQRLQQSAVPVEAQHLVGVAVGHQERALAAGIDVVRLGQHALAPASEVAAIAVEHHDRPVGATLGDMHATLGIHHKV